VVLPVWLAIDAHVDRCPGDSERARILGAQPQATQKHFDTGGMGAVAAQSLSESMRAKIGSAGPSDALCSEGRASKVLNERQIAGVDNNKVAHALSLAKRTWSPGCNSEG
jgi:hypothetical protein